MKSKTPELCVIGGGAAGLAAAVEAARAFQKAGVPGRVTVLEQLPRVGKKLLATGNGRCNLTNRRASPADYFDAVDFVRPAMERFSVDDTLAFSPRWAFCVRKRRRGVSIP